MDTTHKGRLTRWLAGRMIAEGEDRRDPAVRQRLGLLEGWLSIWVNLALGGGKLALGLMLHSAGLIADAFHSLADMATSLVVIIGFRASRKPPDPEHPFGHARAEHVATLVISILLVVAGFELGKEAVAALLAMGSTMGPPLTWGLFAVLAGLLLVKEALAWFSNALGRIIDSDTLKADGWHHRTDALSTGIVILGLAGRNVGVAWLDPAAGLLVALFILVTGGRMAFRAISPLLGEAAPAEQIERLRAIAQQVASIENIHELRVQRYGSFHFTTAHIELPDTMSVHKMHEITVQLETRILKQFPGECVVHVDPIDFNHPLFNRVADVLRDLVVANPILLEFHDLKLWNEGAREHGDVEISVEPASPPDSHAALSKELEAELDRAFPSLNIAVRLIVDFSATPIS